MTNVARSVDGIAPPEATASNPFPNGILRPTGNAAGRLQNIAGDVYFNEQYRKSPVIRKWSLDVQRDLGNETALKIGYVGSSGKDLAIGGTFDSVVNINQLADPYLALGERLNRRYPNPFYGNADFGAFAASRTLPLGQLLRPYPHFRNVYARHVSSGKIVVQLAQIRVGKAVPRQLGGEDQLHVHAPQRQHLRGQHVIGEPERRRLQHPGRLRVRQVPRARGRLLLLAAPCAARDET